MIQKNEVLTREDNCISLIPTKRTTTQEDHPTIVERRVPMNMTEQTWIFEVAEQTRISRTSPKLVDTLVKVMKWLSHLGSGKIDDSCLESRQNIHNNITIKRIGL